MKKYRLDMDFLLSHLDFSSKYDETDDDEVLITIREENKDAFIGEVVGRFTELLGRSLETVRTREEYYPFDKVKAKIEEDAFGFHLFKCPLCGNKNFKEDWNSSEDLRPRCLYCEKPIWMKKA